MLTIRKRYPASFGCAWRPLCGKVVPKSPPCTWLTDVELTADRALRESGQPRVVGRQLGRLHLQRVGLACGIGRAVPRYLGTPDDHH